MAEFDERPIDAPLRVVGRPYVKGQTGNPGGRPKTAAEFRRKCREAADRVLTQIAEGIALGRMPTARQLNTLQVLGDRGGYPTTDRLLAGEVSRDRVILAAIESERLTDQQREEILARWRRREDAPVGDDE